MRLYVYPQHIVNFEGCCGPVSNSSPNMIVNPAWNSRDGAFCSTLHEDDGAGIGIISWAKKLAIRARGVFRGGNQITNALLQTSIGDGAVIS